MGEKTEKATPKKRRDSREKEGNVLQSKEIMTAVSVLGLFWVLSLLGEFMYASITISLEQYLTEVGEYHEFTEAYLTEVGLRIVSLFIATVGPMLLAAMVFAVLPTIIQTKGLMNFKSLRPKFSKLNPFTGIKRLFSLQSIMNILKSIIEIVVIVAIVYQRIKDSVPVIIDLMDMDLLQGVLFTANNVIGIAFTVSMLLAFVAAGDYVFQWYQYEKKLKMTKQDIKDEYKNTDGDPLIKSKIKQKQREISQKRMMQNVPGSDVVLRNPTHFAVALKYFPKHFLAPVVVAKGKDYKALKIIEIAENSGVTVHEDRPLARMLYETVAIGTMIPIELYSAIAVVYTEILHVSDMDMEESVETQNKLARDVILP